MSYILKRKDFIKSQKSDKIVREALANQVNWGDSLVGRLLNSIMRKANIGIDLIKIDKVIERLRAQFDILKDQIKIKKDKNSFIKLFYIQVSLLLGMLIEEFNKSEVNKDEIIKISKSIRFQISVLDAPDEETNKDKLEVTDKLKEFINKIDVSKGDTKDKDIKGEEVNPDVIQKSPEMENLKKIITQISIKDSDIKNKNEIISLSKTDISSDTALKNMNNMNITQTNVESVEDIYKELVNKWGQEQKKLGKNSKPGQGTRNRLMKQAKLQASENQKDVKNSDDKTASTGSDLDQLVTKSIENLNKMRNSEEWKEYDIDGFIEKIKDFQKNKDLSGLLKYLLYFTNLKPKTQSSPKKETGVLIGERQKFIKGYSEFIKEDQLSLPPKKEEKEDIKDAESEVIPNEKEKDPKKIEQEEKNIKVIFEEIFTKEFMKKYEFDEDDIKKLDEELVSEESASITIDPIIEILKIFNRAYKIHTPGIIPSGRTGGKVSNSVFREYEYVGDSGSGGTPDSPGAGPYRNKVIFDKWESAVLDIIKDPEYQQIFNEKTYFHFSPADPRFNTSKDRKEGGGKSLLKMINELLDGGKLYKSGAQQKFISEYFDVQVDSKKLGFVDDAVKNAKTADKQKEDKPLVFKKVDDLKDVKIQKNSIFKRTSKDNLVWYFKIFLVSENDTYFIMSNGFPYDLKLKDRPGFLTDKGNLWFGYTDKFKDGKIVSRVKIELEETLENSEVGSEIDFSGTKLEVLCNDDNSIFISDSNIMSSIKKQQQKIDHLKNQIDRDKDNWKKIIKNKK